MRDAHLSFRFSILCNYFAHENRNYPFCSPAFVPVSYTHLDVYKRQNHSIDSLAALLLFAMYVLFLLFLMLFGAGNYQASVKSLDTNNHLYTASSYICLLYTSVNCCCLFQFLRNGLQKANIGKNTECSVEAGIQENKYGQVIQKVCVGQLYSCLLYTSRCV